MSQECNSQAASPYEQLLELAAGFLSARFPERAASIAAGDHWRIIESFTIDALTHHGFSTCLHRLSTERQQQLIGGIEGLIFEDLPQALIDFYQRKFDQPAPVDVLEVAKEV